MSYRLGFWVIAFAFLAVLTFSAIPSPLYVVYQQRDGFSSSVLTLLFGIYAFGVIASLFLFGHLSDSCGRRRLLGAGVSLSAASAVVFLVWQDVPGLLVGRFVNGISVGMVMATATAYLTELHLRERPGAPLRRPEVAAAAASFGGIAVGPLAAGVLAEYVSDPLTTPYAVSLVALLVALLGVTLAPETHPRTVPPPRYRPQRVAVPREHRAQFFAAATGLFVGFASLSLFSCLAPTILASSLNHSSVAMAGLSISAVFGAGVASQIWTMSWPLRHLLASGSSGLVVGLATVVAAVWIPEPSLAMFLAGGAVAGAGGGAFFRGLIAIVASIAGKDKLAEALAGLYLAGYLGMGIPIVAVGVALDHMSARAALLLFGLVATASLGAATGALLRQRQDATEGRLASCSPR